MDKVESSDTPVTTESQPLSPAERFARLLSTPVEDGDADKPDAGATSPKKPAPVTEPPAKAAKALDDEDSDVDEEDTETETPKLDEAPRYKVKVDGEEQEVPLDELLKGYSYNAHNTRTAQKLAADRKELEAKQKEVAELNQQYREVLPKLEEIAQKAVDKYAGVDWDRLRTEDPAAFAEHRAAYQLEQEKLRAVQEERAAEQAKMEKEQLTEFSAMVAREHEALLTKVPEWKDESKRNAELAEIAKFSQTELGFSAEDLQGMFDHRVIRGLRLAYLGSQMLANAEGATRKVKEARKSAAPGKREADAAPDAERLKLARANLKKSGRERDAAEAFTALLTRKS